MRLFVWGLRINSFIRNKKKIIGLFLRNSGLDRMKMIYRVKLLQSFLYRKVIYFIQLLKIRKCYLYLVLRLEIYIALKLTS